MRDRLPAAVLHARKKGFNAPLSGWLAGELREFTYDVLAPARLRRQGLLDPTAVRHLVDEHMTRVVDRSREIWALLFLVVWHDEVLHGARPTAAPAAPAAPAYA